MIEDAVEYGNSVFELGYLGGWELDKAKKHGTSWYRSKENSGGHPFSSYMLNKKWIFEEEFYNHMLRFQQVTVSFIIILVNYILTFQAGLLVTEVPFIVEPPDDKPERLRLEHFYFPLGLWLAGLVVSGICLLAEIIIKWRENQQ